MIVLVTWSYWNGREFIKRKNKVVCDDIKGAREAVIQLYGRFPDFTIIAITVKGQNNG